MIKIAKYEFDSKEQAETKIASLGTATDMEGNEYPSHPHTIVQLGYIVLQQGTYDEDGNELTAPVLSDKWHVDALFNGLDEHPQVWESYAVEIDGDGVHSFLGLSYNAHKF